MQGQVWIVVQCALRSMRCAPLLGLRSVSPPWRWLTAVPTRRGADNTWWEKSREWALTVDVFFLCNLDLSIYTSAAVLFIDMTPLYLLSAENRCSPIRKVNLDITVELRKSEIFLIIHFGTACFYWWCGDRGPLSKWGESEGDSSDISCQCSHFEASHVTCVLTKIRNITHRWQCDICNQN